MKLPIEVKKKYPLYPLYLCVSIVMLSISISFLFFPFIASVKNALAQELVTAYMVLGGICTLFFAFTSAILVFAMVSPQTAIKITESGLYDYTVAGVGAGFIPKDAIVSLKSFGSKSGLFLGIKIDTKYLDELWNNKKVKLEVYSNINSGLPAVIIRQNDIRMPINELLRIILDAYSEVSLESKKKLRMAKSAFAVEDLEPITVSDDKENPSIQATTSAAVQGVIHTISDDDTEAQISYKQFSLSSNEEEYSPILVGPEKRRVKTVDDLLAQLNIKNSSTKSKVEGQNDTNEAGNTK